MAALTTVVLATLVVAAGTRASASSIRTRKAYVKLMGDLDATYLEYGGFNETNGGVASLHVAGTSDWVLSRRARRQFRIRRRHSPSLRAGGHYRCEQRGLLADVELPRRAGLDVIMTGELEIKLNYDGRFSDSSELHAGLLKAGVKF